LSALAVQHATVRRGGRLILGPASLEIGTGEMLALIGPNGSGKSTLLRLLAGLWRPDEGEALLDGHSIHSQPRKQVARRIAFVPQDAHIDFAFTVREILAMGRYAHRGRFAPQTETDRAAMRSAAAHCDIANLMDRLVNTLSGGERQRVLIARSLVGEPEFILLDEPTANLDIHHALDVLHLCQALAAQGKTTVVATHDFNLVTRYATRLVLLHAGSLVAEGPRDVVLRPEIIQDVFHVDVELASTRAGEPAYVFHQRVAG
jgi:iron complex transport system ATP-binding protein